MGSPKREDQQQLVPDTNLCIDTIQDLRGFFGFNNNNNVDEIEEEGGKNGDEMMYNSLGWDFTSSSWEVDQVFTKEQEMHNVSFNTATLCDEISVKEEDIIDNNNNNVGYWGECHSNAEDETKSSCLNLNLNYDDVLEAWSNRPFSSNNHHHHHHHRRPFVSTSNNHPYMGEVPNLDDERKRRESSVIRYKEKRQNRLFAKKIRYEVRKQNADKRPRHKGRFVRRGSDDE